jgi:integrase
MGRPTLRVITPTSENRTVTPLRRPNKDLRTREHLDRKEVERLMKAASKNRNGHRDGTMVLIAFRHGLRASELCDLRWEQVDFARKSRPRPSHSPRSEERRSRA